MSSDFPSSPAARAFFAALDGETSSAGASAFVKKRIQTLGWRNRYSQVEFYPVTVDGVNFSVRQVQRGELEGTYGTGATVWPASVVLLKYLEKHADKLLRNKRIVDLGSGTGITAIAAALLGAKEVVCTDGEPNVVKLAVENLQHAFGELTEQVDVTDGETKSIRGCPLHIQTYWWCSGAIHGGNTADVILVSDCVLPKLYPIGPLVDAIDELLVNPTSVAILSYEYRYYPEFDPGEEFRRLCALKGLDVESIPLSEHDPVYSVEDIEVWHVRRRVA
jgi:predicted nicotinamide N-methyase